MADAFDGITEFWWRDEADFAPANSTIEQLMETQQQLLGDEQKFIDTARSILFTTVEHEIYSLDTPPTGSLL